VSWKSLTDTNVENRNAGNGGDLVKHTVYLVTLQFLLKHPPWNQGMRLRECHAGRGIYKIARGDSRLRTFSALFSKTSVAPLVLVETQRKILRHLGCWPDSANGVHWYAGSALMNALTLAHAESHVHEVDLYEWEPETRRILRAVVKDMPVESQVELRILPGEEKDQPFDGEAYIEEQIGEWHKQDVILLDPFAMWRQASDQSKRNRYGAIVNRFLQHGLDAPSLILFWTWGRAFPVAEGDLNDTIDRRKNGYQELRAKFHKAGFQIVRVSWRWGLQFAMWVVVPKRHVGLLRDDVELHCRRLSGHLNQTSIRVDI
jgi:hypothetical protein